LNILQINTTINSGSHGRIAEDIGKLLISQGHQSFIAYGRGDSKSKSNLIKIGREVDILSHGLYSRLLDRHGFGSTHATERFIQQIEYIKPDIIHLHNIHGYYLNIRLLFNYLHITQIPVVWTLHDCWPFTGHCSYFELLGCERWKSKCFKCPNIHAYPKSIFIDQSEKNFKKKQILFNVIKRMVIVTPSQWLADHVKNSFLSNYSIKVINNGVDIDIFKPTINIENKKIYCIKTDKMLLGVANIWDQRKGLNDFIQLRKMLSKDISICLVGLKEAELKCLPEGIVGIKRTDNINDLAKLYATADVFVNPTYVDNFPTTNIEALACGTPVLTYNTGGSPESINSVTGKVIKKGDVQALSNAINIVLKDRKNTYSEACRQRAINLYDSKKRYQDYIDLYHSIIAEY